MQLVRTQIAVEPGEAATEEVARVTGRWPAIALILMGAAIVYCLGFSNLPRAHAATHDTRHASGFPCH